jgi:hypothetical protein
LASLSHLKAQMPLPETADELCDVAQDVRADTARDIRLGSQATEREVKRLSASGELAKYRMVHFATHGTIAGELKGTHEPGLILTPPERATERTTATCRPQRSQASSWTPIGLSSQRVIQRRVGRRMPRRCRGSGGPSSTGVREPWWSRTGPSTRTPQSS